MTFFYCHYILGVNHLLGASFLSFSLVTPPMGFQHSSPKPVLLIISFVDQSLCVFVPDLFSSSIEMYLSFKIQLKYHLDLFSLEILLVKLHTTTEYLRHVSLIVSWCFCPYSRIQTHLWIFFLFSLDLSIIWSLLTESNCHFGPLVSIYTCTHPLLFV